MVNKWVIYVKILGSEKNISNKLNIFYIDNIIMRMSNFEDVGKDLVKYIIISF